MARLTGKERTRQNRRTLARPYDTGTPAQREAGTARLDPFYGAVIVEDDPLAPDAALVADLDDLIAYGAGVADRSTAIRADGDSKHRRYCEPCGKWYMADAQLARHRAKVHPGDVHRTAPAPSPRIIRKVSAADIMPRRTAQLDPCPRCGRLDWQTAAGREWHLANYPACAARRKPEKHQYQEVSQ